MPPSTQVTRDASPLPWPSQAPYGHTGRPSAPVRPVTGAGRNAVDGSGGVRAGAARHGRRTARGIRRFQTARVLRR